MPEDTARDGCIRAVQQGIRCITNTCNQDCLPVHCPESDTQTSASSTHQSQHLLVQQSHQVLFIQMSLQEPQRILQLILTNQAVIVEVNDMQPLTNLLISLIKLLLNPGNKRVVES